MPRQSASPLKARYANSTVLSLPHLAETFEPLEIILLLNPAFHSIFRQDRHHLPQGDAGQFSSSAKRCFPLFVSFHREQDSATGDHVPHGLGKITPLFLRELDQEVEVLTIHPDAHGLTHSFVSNFRLASSKIDCL